MDQLDLGSYFMLHERECVELHKRASITQENMIEILQTMTNDNITIKQIYKKLK